MTGAEDDAVPHVLSSTGGRARDAAHALSDEVLNG
jgi:hypothetical protein